MQVEYKASLASNLVQFLAWIALGALLFLRPNRRFAAWSALLPAGLFQAVLLFPVCLPAMSTSANTMLLPFVQAVLMGSAGLVLYPWEKRPCSLLAALGRVYGVMAVMSACSQAANVGVSFSQTDVVRGWMLFLPVLATFPLGAVLTALLTRRRLSGQRFGLWLLPISVAAALGTVVIILTIQMVLAHPSDEQVAQALSRLLPIGCIWGGAYWLIALPYVFVAFGSEFFRTRMRAALHLPSPQQPPAPVAEASEEQLIGEAR